MKTKLTHRIFAALCVVAIISSCTIEKRRYTDGYHIEGLGHNKKVHKAEPIAIEETTAVETEVVNEDVTTVVTTEAAEPVLQQDVTTQPTNELAEASNVTVTKKEIKKALRTEIKAARREARMQEIREPSQINQGQTVSPLKDSDSAEPDTILLVILALFIPPLAVYLYQGSWDGVCWLNLILTLLFFLPGVIHALLVILDVI